MDNVIVRGTLQSEQSGITSKRVYPEKLWLRIGEPIGDMSYPYGQLYASQEIAMKYQPIANPVTHFLISITNPFTENEWMKF